jgi:hypothetical protein
VALLDDVQARERYGIEESECEQVRHALGRMVNAASAFPDGSLFQTAIYEELESFLVTYTKWNGVKGSDTEAQRRREDLLKALRSHRNKIAKTVRRNQYVLENQLDLEMTRAFFEAARTLVVAVPDIFKHLAQAIARFDHATSSPG